MAVGKDYERVFETEEGRRWLVGEPSADDSGVRIETSSESCW
jgi:hypothetical protein